MFGWGQVKNSINTYALGDQKPASATIAQASWLAGSWKGQGFDGTVEEIWTAPAAGVMVGAFRMLKDEKNVFFEFVNLSETDGSLIMHVKHFSEDLTGWEEKDETVAFPLVQISDNELNFEGLTYRKTGPNSMMVYVVISKDEKSVEVALTFTRQK